MTINQVFKKAKEGGDKMQWDKGLESAYPYRALLDDNFWIALGKAMGWNMQEHQYDDAKVKKIQGCTRIYLMSGWLYQWHKFIDHLAAGKTIESYFENL